MRCWALIGVIALPSFERHVLRRLIETPWIRRSPLLVKSLAAASTLVDAITRLGTPRRLAAIVFLSAVAWAFEGSVFLVAAIASGVSGGPLAAFFALPVATLATLFPSSPGYIGTFHFFAMQAVIVFGTLGGNGGALCDHRTFALMAPDDACRLRLFSMAGATRP